MLFDLASEHGTYLNGKKLLRPKYLADWDEIALGRFVFVFRCPEV
jgi:pSer/pThr/pTyr-binding forkhead associated (FHA) protein